MRALGLVVSGGRFKFQEFRDLLGGCRGVGGWQSEASVAKTRNPKRPRSPNSKPET